MFILRPVAFLTCVSASLSACPPSFPCEACGRCWSDEKQKVAGGCTDPCKGPPAPPSPPPSPPSPPTPPGPSPPSPPTPPGPPPPGGLKRLEPLKSQVVNAVGQCGTTGTMYYGCQAAIGYQRYLNTTLPSAIMAYIGIVDPAQTVFDNLGQLQADLQNKTAGYLHEGKQLGFQFGVWFADGGEVAVAAGKHDDAIDALITAFNNCTSFPVFCKAPIWLRIGYEFNGEWNDYNPDAFKSAWIRITKKLRANAHTNKYVATVWDFSSDATEPKDLDYMQWYPGDEYVDWWGVNVFSEKEGHAGPKNTDTLKFLADAKSRGFPVMLGECTPRAYSVTLGQQAVDDWFKPYFDLISNPAHSIRFASYINWDWTTSNWPAWGDAEIQKNDVVGSMYRNEMLRKRTNGESAWLHLQPTEDLGKFINLAGPGSGIIEDMSILI